MMKILRVHASLRSSMRLGLLIWVVFAITVQPACAQNVVNSNPAEKYLSFFRVGSGATSGTYFVIGGLLANAISSPPGARPCERGGTCGVPGMIAVAQSTEGSVENIELLRSGALESALVQADIAHQAFYGSGRYQGVPRRELRVIAALYPDMLHLAVPADSFITKVADIRGKTVSLGEENSGTQETVLALLQQVGVARSAFSGRSLKPGQASDALAAGQLDAMFLLGGYPLTALRDLANRIPLRLVPVSPASVEALLPVLPSSRTATIPADVYKGIAATDTLAVPVLWLVHADVNAATVAAITRSLWHPTTSALLKAGHPQGARIHKKSAFEGVHMPIHAGAEQYYREMELVPTALPVTH